MPISDNFRNFLNVQPNDPFPGGGKFAMLIDEEDCGKRVRAELIELQPQEGFPLHTHPKSDHVIIVVQGEGYLLWEGEERGIAAGDTFVVPMGDIHSIQARNDTSLRFIVINVPPIDFQHHDFMQPVDSQAHNH